MPDPATLAAGAKLLGSGLNAAQGPAPAPTVSKGGTVASGDTVFNFGPPAIRDQNGELISAGIGGNTLVIVGAAALVVYLFRDRLNL